MLFSWYFTRLYIDIYLHVIMKISNFFIILKCSFLLRKNIYIYKETGVLGETNLDINCTVMISIMMIIFFYQNPYFFDYTKKCEYTKESERSMRIKRFYSPTTPFPVPRFAHELLNLLTIIGLFILSKLFYFWPSVAK